MSQTRLADGETFESLRVFQIGLFKGTMRRLLLRADKTPEDPTRIDVLFMNATHINIPSVLEGLRITDVTGTRRGDEITDVSGHHAGQDSRLYDVQSSNFHGFVVAGSVSYRTDEGEYWEPSGFDMEDAGVPLEGLNGP